MNKLANKLLLVFIPLSIILSYGAMFSVEVLNVNPYNPLIISMTYLAAPCYGISLAVLTFKIWRWYGQ